MADTFCPRCGRERTGSFRFCRDCGFDFDDAVMALGPDPERAVATQTLSVPPPTTPAAERPKRPARFGRYVAVAVVGLLGISALSTLTTKPPAAVAPPTTPAPTATGGPPTPARIPTTVTPAVGSPTTAPTAVAFGPTGPTETGTVNRVVDGDTIRVIIDGVDVPVRYIGMDTPEPDATDPTIKRLADAATAANVALVDGREVILERDASDTDQYDRLLRDVWVQDESGAWLLVNLELVRLGFAQMSTYPPDVKYVDLLTDAQSTARTDALGLWSVPDEPAGIDTGSSDCDSSYPDVCIPPYPPDLDCGQIGERRFAVRGPDPHGFDSDRDGIGCESG